MLYVFLGAISARSENGVVDKYFSHKNQLINDNSHDKAIGNEILYQIVVDRFENGNYQNDCLYGGHFCSRDHSEWFKYWGGDLRGVVNRLSYLKNLNVTRLWLTPIFENVPVDVDYQLFGRPAKVTSYHGYWIRDWFRLSPFFTDTGWRDFSILDEVIQKALPEMRIFLDTVTNHSNPANATAESLAYLTM